MVGKICIFLGTVFLAGCSTVPVGPSPEETIACNECADSPYFRSQCCYYGRKDLVGRVYFDFDGAKMSDGDRQALKSVAAELNAYPERGVLLMGFCDGKGKEDYNISLCQKRIEAVAEALQAEGVAAGRLKGDPKGTVEGLASRGQIQLDRRVDILFR